MLFSSSWTEVELWSTVSLNPAMFSLWFSIGSFVFCCSSFHPLELLLLQRVVIFESVYTRRSWFLSCRHVYAPLSNVNSSCGDSSAAQPTWLKRAFTGSARDFGCMTTRGWWLLSETARSSTQCSSWTLSSTTKVLVSTAVGSLLELSKTWTVAWDNSTPGICCLQPPQWLHSFNCADIIGEYCASSRLFVVRGKAEEVFPKLFSQWKITKLTYEYDTEPSGLSRDKTVTRLAEEHGIDVVSKVSHTLFDINRYHSYRICETFNFLKIV